MTLYEINNQIANFDPEVDEDTGELLNADLLDRLNMDRDAKIESICLYIKNLDAEANAIKSEKQSLDERQKQKERKRDSLKKYLESALAGEKFETAKCKVSFRKTTSVSIGDLFYPWAEANAPELLRITQKVEPDKAAIKEALKNGMEMVDAELTEGVSLSVK